VSIFSVLSESGYLVFFENHLLVIDHFHLEERRVPFRGKVFVFDRAIESFLSLNYSKPDSNPRPLSLIWHCFLLMSHLGQPNKHAPKPTTVHNLRNSVSRNFMDISCYCLVKLPSWTGIFILLLCKTYTQITFLHFIHKTTHKLYSDGQKILLGIVKEPHRDYETGQRLFSSTYLM
jgi:hypothetical protein